MFTITQILLVTLFLSIMTFLGHSVQIFTYGATVFYGWVTGLIMGDPATGLLIGGTLQLMGLGVGGWGGSSVPNYALGCTVGVLFAVATGQGMEAGLAIGIPVAALGVQLDVLAKTAGSFFIHRAQACSEKCDWKGMNMWIWLSNIPRIGLTILPVLLVMTAGADVVNALLKAMPVWLITGLNVAGGLLPAMGFAILIKFLPVSKYGMFMILGFVMTAYLNLPMLGTALIGLVAAMLIFNQLNAKAATPVVAVDGGDNYDE